MIREKLIHPFRSCGWAKRFLPLIVSKSTPYSPSSPSRGERGLFPWKSSPFSIYFSTFSISQSLCVRQESWVLPTHSLLLNCDKDTFIFTQFSSSSFSFHLSLSLPFRKNSVWTVRFRKVRPIVLKSSDSVPLSRILWEEIMWSRIRESTEESQETNSYQAVNLGHHLFRLHI